MGELMRPRIFRGWAVIDNKFYDVSPIPADSDSTIDNCMKGL